MTVTRYDRAPLKATKTPEGFLQDSPILSRVGVFPYRQADGKIRNEYRSADEVFHADHLASIMGKPITDDHHGRIEGTNARGKVIGACLSAGRQDTENADNLRGDIIIHDFAATATKQELSLGYTLDLDETPGVFNGIRYDAVQRNLRVNHLALVAKGRAGNARLNLDAADAVIDEPKEEPKMTMVKMRLDNGLEYDAAPEVSIAFAASQSAVKTVTDRADALTAERDALKAKVDAHEASLTKLREDAVAEVKRRSKLEADATAFGAKFAQDAKDADIRIAVIKAVRGDTFDATGKSDAYLEVAYDLAVADGTEARKKAGQNRADAAGGKPATNDTPASASSARAKMISNLTAGAK